MAQFRALLLVVATLLGAALSPGLAQAKVTLGADVAKPPPSGGFHLAALGCQKEPYSPCTYVNMRSTNPDVVVAAPFDGVIVKWRTRAGCCTETQTVARTMTLVTIKQGVQDGAYGYVYGALQLTGTSFELTPGSQILSVPATEFPARLPIKAGERFGVRADDPFAFGVDDTIPGVTSTVLFNGVVSGGENYGSGYGVPMMMSADVEPDGDADGYGDETQDCKPADPLIHDTGCDPAPIIPQTNHDLLSVGINCPNGSCPAQLGPAADPTPAPPPPPPPVVPILSAVPASPDGTRFNVSLYCPPTATVRCGGVLVLNPAGGSKARRLAAPAASTANYGSATYAIDPGKKLAVKVKLNSRGRKALKKKGKLRVSLTLQPTGGVATSFTRTLTVKKPTKKR